MGFEAVPASPDTDTSPASRSHSSLRNAEIDTTYQAAKPSTNRSTDAIKHDQPQPLPPQRPQDSPVNQSGQHHGNTSSDSSSSSDESDDPAVTQKPKKRRTFGLTRAKTEKKDKEINKNYPKKTNSALSPKGFNFVNAQLHAKGKVSKQDGRLKISLNHQLKAGVLGQALTSGLRHHVGAQAEDSKEETEENIKEGWQRTQLFDQRDWSMTPKLNIVIMVIGSRGDIQPFIKIARLLKEEHGHRVRVATHPAFRAFIEDDCKLEFFSIGGNPSELMAFMVKNPGMLPKMETFKEGEIGRRRDQMYEMFEGFWRACIKPTDDLPGRKPDAELEPFIADAIIANPPSFAHVHCAERLGCPLHMIFTFPYTPTAEFPNPLTNIKQGNVDAGYTNFMSYPLVEMMTWQGLGDLVNRFRTDVLGLDPVSTIWAPSQLYRLHVPYTYCWSPSLVPKPADWGPEIDIAGYVFLDLASDFDPPQDLQDFLKADGPEIVYIGFGSIVIDDPDKFTDLIFKAVKKAGVRALVNKGWGGIGGDGEVPENIFMLDNTPHDWLFPKCAATVQHGGAGTVAIAMKCGKPTMIVPFFGDQPFWGSMISKAGAGAKECIRYKDLTVDKFAEGIKQCLTEEAKQAAQKIANSIAKEGDGAENAVKSFHAHLPWKGQNAMYCSFLPDRVAVWRLKGSTLKLSALAAEISIRQKKIQYKQLRVLRHYEWNDFQGPGAPMTGTASGVVRSITGIGKGLAEGPMSIGKDIHKHQQHKKRRSVSLGAGKKKQSVDLSAEVTTIKGEAKLDKAQSKQENHLMRDRGHATANTLPENTQQSGQVTSEITSQQESSDKHGTRKASSSTTDDGNETADTLGSADEDSDFAEHLAKDFGRGFLRPLGAVAEVPMNILTGLGLGLHNAPRLYGDTTVRRPGRITGFNSGMHAAINEFFLGTYDAFSGVVTQPYNGAKESGATGLIAGVGKGLAGLVLKESAALVAPLGMAMVGVKKEMGKTKWMGGHGGDSVTAIREARIQQGVRAVASLTQATSPTPSQSHDAPESAREKDNSKSFDEVNSQIQDGWATMEELWRRADAMRHDGGIHGRMELEKTKKAWEKYGVFESVAMCREALKAIDRGRDLESYLREERKRRVVQGDVVENAGGK